MISKLTATQRQYGLVLLVGIVVFFTNLGGPKLFDEDEPKNAECGREMFVRGDWIVPTFNEELRTDKPILLYWGMLVSFTLFGVNEFGARFTSATMATGTVVIVYLLGRRLFEPKVGVLSAIILATSLMYVTVARAATPDATLIFFTTLSLYLFAAGVKKRQEQSKENQAIQWPVSYVPARITDFLTMYAAMGCAVLAKGPVGFLLPCTVIGLFLLVTGEWHRRASAAEAKTESQRTWTSFLLAIVRPFAPYQFIKALLAMRPILLATTVMLVALPWYIAVGIQTDGAWIQGFLGGHNVGRFVSAMENHSGPIVYYIPVIALGFFPWSVFLPAAGYGIGKKLQKPSPDRLPCLFLCCWVGVYIVFFSLAQTKLPNYVLPCYPALAMVTAYTLIRWQQDALAISTRWIKNGVIGSVVAGGLLLVALPVALHFILPGHYWIASLAMIPLFGGIASLYLLGAKGREVMLYQYAGCSILGIVVAFAGVGHIVSHQQDSPHFGQRSKEIGGESRQIATYNYFAPNLVFYGEKRVVRIRDIDHINKFFASEQEPLLLMRSDHFEKVRSDFPDEAVIVEQRRRFLRQHDLLLIGRKSTGDRIAAEANNETLLR